VLAHVQASARLPSSNHDATYVGFVRHHVGPAEQRLLAEDAAVLGRVVSTHDALSRLQLIGWLFESTERAVACAEVGLDQLSPCEVDEPELLPTLQCVGPAVEVLRCAALLELEAWSALPKIGPEHAALRASLDRVSLASPQLERCRVRMVRSLRLRGRVRRREIWVGAPIPQLALSPEHAAWQAAHEATVCEVSEAMAAMDRERSFRCMEKVAVVLLTERAQEAGLEREHARWLAHLGNLPPTRAACLTFDETAVWKWVRARE
jgi:hypothetical protein